MSLVGSLEDLGLGEILQIISLSRKSGTLRLRSGHGEGEITFRDGEIRSAEVKGGATDLAELLVRRGLLDRAASERLLREARRAQTPLEVLLAGHDLPVERLDELRRSHVHETVLAMFLWRAGEFSFEVGSAVGTGNGLALEPGLNPQFLALEGTRLQDEQAAHELQEAAPAAPDPRPGPGARPATAARGPLVAAEIARRAVVVIASRLGTLEAIKHSLRDRFDLVHIFQRTDLAVGRIRQYLGRGETPVVLLTPDVPPDPLSGARGWRELTTRLKAQAGHMPVFLVSEEGVPEVPVPPADGVLPATDRSPRLGEILYSTLGGDAPQPRVSEPLADALSQLRQANERLGDPTERAEVLPLVLRFASELCRRVAIFMVQDELAVGLAQMGLAESGGPDDQTLQQIVLPVRGPAWFRRVLETGRACNHSPHDEGDRQLAGLLGPELPARAIVAPIESGGRVVALVYGDNLPGDDALPEPALLTPVLEEAGLALERALRARQG